MTGTLRKVPLKDRLPGGAHHRVCSRCVMDTSDPEITFDATGNCHHCTEYLEVRSLRDRPSEGANGELDRQLNMIRVAGIGKSYDCVIGMSGGVDSSYLAYLVCRQFKLRPLAVHMDNGWDSADAVSNIRSVIDALEIDYESVVLDWPSFRSVQVAFLKASVPEAETPTDVAIPEALHSVAARHGIRYILSAGNIATEGILPRSWHYNARDAKYFRSICTTFGSGVPEGVKFFDYRREAYFKLFAGIKTVYPLNHLRFRKEEVIKLLEREFSFRYYGQKHYESRFTRFIQSYYLFVKFGIDYRRASYSSLIMDGQMERDDALRLLAGPPYDARAIEADKEYVARKLGLATDDLDEIMRQLPSYYWDHPRDEKKLGMIYGLYRSVFGKQKLASV